MSYLVLARKYRPKTFESLVGQDHVVRALTHALESQRLHHAYLFTGTRGVGKTTLSRLLAKSLNCETGITARPCGACEACQAIDADRFVDYIEMDAASNRGIADMLQLLEQAVYAPTSARFKVYMIDEVHMLTAQAFNAMLKTLEEPPEYIKFILATTDPQKIPVTVLSRCLQFNLKQMPPLQIVEYLDQVLEQEKITFEKPALRLLADGANGSMRDALSLTDQAISYTAGNVSLAAVQDMLGSLDQTYLIRILDSLVMKDGEALMGIADEMAARSLSYSSALKDLGVLINRIALAQTAPSALPEDLPEYEDILRFAGLFNSEDMQLFYQIVVHGRNELGLAPDEYAGFTMTLLRMLAFQPGRDEGTSPPVSGTPSAAASKPSSAGQDASAKAPSLKPAAEKPLASPPPLSQPGTPADVPPWMDLEEANPPPQTQKADAVRGEPAISANDEFLSVAGLADPDEEEVVVADLPKPSLDWDEDWPALAESLSLRGMAQQLAQQTELVYWKQAEGVLQFHLRVPLETLSAPAHVEKLKEALMNRFECSVKITTEIGKVGLTASQNALEKRANRQREAEEAIHNDTYVQSLVREFGASIVPNSIKPI
ncbi:DNA polymerase III subunit gamma/tau [Oxalobacter sp. OttesenSCG-928-P03]|nr:DNA polymerase III subunit gamma/tau [Oxalobacter sp. OttesenSCG-928-P03]